MSDPTTEHIADTDDQPIDYLCDDCGEVFSEDERKAEHYRVITNGGWHWGPWQYTCPHCGSLDIAPAPDGD